MIISQLQGLYPHGVLELDMGTTARPTIDFSSGEVEGHFQGSIKYNVRLPNTTLVYAFTTSVVCSFVDPCFFMYQELLTSTVLISYSSS